MKKKAIVIHSGGMDSSTCLALAIDAFGTENVLSLAFSYGQRHSVELEAAKKICREWSVDHRIIDIGFLGSLTSNALMNPDCSIQLKKKEEAANTLVICRNGLMARLGAIVAHECGASCIYMGLMGREAEHAGYRDCSQEYVNLMQEILRLDLGNTQFEIKTPLMHLSKKEAMEVANELGVLPFLMEHTISCYQGIPKTGCGHCPSCLLRLKGVEEFKQAYPAIVLPY